MSDPAVLPQTRAERSRYTETSRYADVVAFLDTLRQIAPTYTFGTIGTTTEGRAIPSVIAARPRVVTPEDARRTGRPIVYINANIHSGEVEGKEAILALLRDLAADARPNVLDSLVLLVVPIYNADGNEHVGPQSVNRPEQRGPEDVGTRANAMKLDLNRDYVKLEAPETRSALAFMNSWNPDVYVDLHTTDGSYHGYGLTYSPSLSPAAPLGDYSRELLATLRDRLRDATWSKRMHTEPLETFDYGNFDTNDGERDIASPVKTGWYTYDPRPRFGTNYYGIRGGIAVLSEAFSHDPLERRVASTSAFLRGLLSLIAERGSEIRRRVGDARRARPSHIPLGAALTSEPYYGDVLVERLERTGDSVVTQPGVPVGIRRTGQITAQRMPVYDRFVGRDSTDRPAGYLIPAADTMILTRLTWHGVVLSPVPQGHTFNRAQTFRVDSVSHATRLFQGHYETHVTGVWDAPASFTTATAMVYVTADQPLGSLAVYLLEPTSIDGLTTWNFFDAALAQRRYPVIRVAN